MSYSSNNLHHVVFNQHDPFMYKSVLRLAVTLFIIIVSLYSSMTQAQRVTPMVFELEPTGSQSATSLRVENNKEQAMTVEFVVTKVSLDEYGNETRTPAEEDFLIYPPQALIESGKAQIARVKYIGDPVISESVAYRVSVKQLPVENNDPNYQGIGVLVNFNTLVNVSPLDSKAQLSVSEISAGDDSTWNLVIENAGNRFSRLSRTTWEIRSTTDPSIVHTLRQREIGNLLDRNLVVPNSTLRLSMPAIEGFDPANTNITISADG